MSRVRVSVLRHAQVPSHAGDMPLTQDAHAQIAAAVPRLRALAAGGERFRFLATQTKRSHQTAEALRAAIAPEAAPVIPAWGLRNPDLYLAGDRVEMVSTPDAFAAQLSVAEVGEQDVLAEPFFQGFLTAKDRIEYWLRHANPPGESSAAVARRVLQFARSLAYGSADGLVVACVTHSPVMRALLVEGFGVADPGEPGWVEAIDLDITEARLRWWFRDKAGEL
jgi:broad specificity phosphatase PhoE